MEIQATGPPFPEAASETQELRDPRSKHWEPHFEMNEYTNVCFFLHVTVDLAVAIADIKVQDFSYPIFSKHARM